MPVQTQLQQRRGTAASWTSTNPTLAAGEIGFESDTGKIKIGNGSTAWNALAYTASSTAVTYLFNATGGQTTFSGADANGLTLAYTVGSEQVYLNGVLQVRGADYTATNGTSIVLTSGALVSDVLNVIAFSALSLSDTYTQAQANALFVPQSSNYFAGKNKIINGDFSVWQRGTSFSTDGYSADRWRFSKNGGTTATISRQTFTPGAAPAAPYESQYFARYQRTAGAFDDYFLQRVEDARTLANTTSRFSFWAKASANTTISQVYLAQTTNGSGGGASGNFSGLAITTSWARYTVDVSLPSLSGATIGAGSYVETVFKFGSEMGNITVDIWGVQWEQGSAVTPFQTATGTIQGELAACQRYYVRTYSDTNNGTMGMGLGISTTAADLNVVLPVTMRVVPTSMDYFNLRIDDGVSGYTTGTYTLGTTISTKQTAKVQLTGTSGLTQYRPYFLSSTAGTSFVGFSAEL
jgi:hypothetical protein